MNPTNYDYDADDQPATAIIPEVERPRRKLRRLYAPNGDIILTISNRPPVGFHQGQRNNT
jgi:hypothetical protein